MQHRSHSHGRQSPPIWPFLLLLAFLFAMSITSPRHWERFAQRSPLEPPTRKYAGTTVATPLADALSSTVPQPAVGSPADARPRVTSRFVPPTSAARPSEFAQPNLVTAATPQPAGVIRLSGATPRATVAPNETSPTTIADAPLLPAPSSAAPSLSDPLRPGRPAPTIAALPNLTSPELHVPSATGPQQAETSAAPNLTAPSSVSQPHAAAPPMIVQAYRPPPTGFVLHGGHKSDGSTSAMPGPVVAQPQAGPSLPTIDVARVTPKIAEPSRLKPAAPKTSPEADAPAAPAAPAVQQPLAQTQPVRQPELVAGRTAPSATADPLRTLPKQAAAVPAEPRVETPAAKPKSWWPQPIDLLARLASLQENSGTKAWADRNIELLARLATVEDGTSELPAKIFQQLRATLTDPRLLNEQSLDSKTALQVRLTRHALQRRLDVWESLVGVLRKPAVQTARVDAEDLAVCLVELERETAAAGETGRQWRDYLMLDALGASVRNAGDDAVRQELARSVIERMRKAAAADDRNEFLTKGAFAELSGHLGTLAAADLNGRALLESIERFEGGGLPSDAHALAEQCKLLEFSTDAERKQLATWLTSHYRNANVRVTLSADLLNRMLPETLRQNAAVNDTVLGMPTQGWSSTRTGIGIAFLPSNDRLAIRMTAEGVVHAQTQTFSGPVRLFSHSDSTFRAHKDFALTHRGVEVQPAGAVTASRSRLQGIRTEFDHMPILGSIVESIALDQHAEKRIPAQREAAAKVSRQVERGLDMELDKHLRNADAQLDGYCVEPLAKLGLAPEVIELQSNEARAIMRVRVAGDDQLASHTPRPRAYSDNVASVQLHQSAVNNILERLGFQGRHFTAAELYRFAVEELYVPDVIDPADIPGDIEVTFAATDPVTVHCGNGRIELRLSIAELRRGSKSWRDFVVRSEFKTEVFDGSTCFVRDGLIHLSGQRLSATSQIALRTVFAKVFPDEMRLPLWPDQLRNDKRFADLDVGQVDIRDGWIGMAIGPRRVQTTMGLLRPRR